MKINCTWGCRSGRSVLQLKGYMRFKIQCSEVDQKGL